MSVYCCSDFHGMYSLYEQVTKLLKPEDTVYILGDCGDRGPEGWKTITAVYNNPQMIYLMGNHEDMLTKAMEDYINLSAENKVKYPILSSYNLVRCNGGDSTFESWRELLLDEQIDWFTKLIHLPTHLTYLNKKHQKIELTHAGYTPHIKQTLWNDMLLWDRDHFNDDWDEDYPDTIIVHGHTICCTLPDYIYDFYYDKDTFYRDPKIVKYCDEHKIDIDLGSAFTGKAALLNLDTLETTYVYDKEINEQYVKDIDACEYYPRMYWR